MRSHRLFAALLAAPLALAACGDSATAPLDTAALSHEISSNELGQALDTAPARVEIKLERGTLVARKVELKSVDEMSDEESVRGLVTAISADDVSGTLTFEIGGLEVTFASSARFRGEDGDVTFSEFVGRIQDALDAGASPMVRAKRAAPADPQAPDDATFEASDLRLGDGMESPKLELNVDADNYEANDAPPPEAWLHVLGLTIEIRSTTEVRADDDDRDEAEVHGTVASVDVAGGSVTLDDGTVIIVPDGAFEDGEGGDDDGEHLGSLQAVQDALDAGQTVKAEAEGAVQATDPLTILAHEVEFEIRSGDDDEEDGGDGIAGTVEFERMVQSVSVDDGTFVLSNGTVVTVTDTTMISTSGDLASLQAVADALGAGQFVKAEGRAVMESAGPPALLTALEVRWETGEDD